MGPILDYTNYPPPPYIFWGILVVDDCILNIIIMIIVWGERVVTKKGWRSSDSSTIALGRMLLLCPFQNTITRIQPNWLKICKKLFAFRVATIVSRWISNWTHPWLLPSPIHFLRDFWGRLHFKYHYDYCMGGEGSDKGLEKPVWLPKKVLENTRLTNNILNAAVRIFKFQIRRRSVFNFDKNIYNI